MKQPPKKKVVENKSERTWRTRLNEAPIVSKRKPRKPKVLDMRRIFVFPSKKEKK